jgi:DNA polymerase bacteriophage-type
MISIDFETRSATNLLTQGTYNYASCPTTDIICMAYSVDGAEPELWIPGMPVATEFKGPYFYAWNANFERLIWDFIMVEQYGWPPIPLENWRCTAYASRCNNLPGALGNAARCLKVAEQKDKRGAELIKLLSISQTDGTFCTDPDLLTEMYAYCLQDVRTEQAVYRQLREPTPEEWADYHANERINDRGIRIDRAICQHAQVYADEELADLIGRIEELTDGAVVKARGENLKAWVVERLTEEQQKLLVKHRKGEKMLSLDKYNRSRLLALEDIDPIVREVVECSDFAQKSSVGKFRAMDLLADPEDDRVRGALLANGASASGRYSSKGAQVHNFPRDGMDDPEAVRADFVDEICPEDITDYFKLPIMTILSRMLRPALIPAAGSVFLAADWSAIEGRVAPWLCDNVYGEAKLNLYRADEDIYKIAASHIYNTVPDKVTKEQRQVGKVAELSLQYGGGENAFLGMARGYGVVVSVAQAKSIKVKWRATNPWAQHIWNDIERAAMLAIRRPGERFKAGRLSYFAVENILCGGVTLFCELPCGRLLTYPDCRVETVDGQYGVRQQLTCLRAAFVPKVGEKEWPRSSLWGGLLFENAVQGTAASLLREAVRRAEMVSLLPSTMVKEITDEFLPVVLHVHDEIVVEVPEKMAEVSGILLEEIMNRPPVWAETLPLAAEVKVLQRFGK